MFSRRLFGPGKKSTKDSSSRANGEKCTSRDNAAEAMPDRFSNWKEFLGNDLSLKVLVIDQDNAERSIITNVIESCGASVTAAADGGQATGKMRHTRFEMIFSGLRVPGLDGFQLIDTVKRTSPETQVYIITPYETMRYAVACTKRGAEGFILKPVVADQVAVLVARARDRKQLRRLAYTDGLTSLFNRDSLKQFLLQECHRSARHGYSFALLILDVDHFKEYNDMNGHLIGDLALIKLGKLLKQSTRASDIPARYGGDEFAVILTEITLFEALVRAGRIRKMISSTPFQRERNMPGGKLTVSVGVALYPEHGSGFLEIMESADRALYRAKAEGRNRVCVFEKMTRNGSAEIFQESL